MAQIGDISLAAISGSQKNAAALVSLNFDFALVKFSAPAEYQDVGTCLSPWRKKEAEDGHFHAITRKLAVLFVGEDLPDVPYLTEACGKRASEISKNRTFNPKGSTKYGAFAPHIGADATSIWAAATSGRGAVAIHLLACMLAYIFEVPQAISIWSELISKRQQIIQNRVQGEEYRISDITASQIRLDRKDLAEWDASARSWLQIADSAHALQQSQLKIIAQNVDRSLPSGPDPYTSVKNAWHRAMVTLDKLIQGVPHDIQDPEVLLGLLAWHIYPDMNVVSGATKVISQNDPLVKATGIITLGLKDTPLLGYRGISWSLPLSHLRYYGQAVISTGSVEEASSRVPFRGLLFVTLGTFTRSWLRKGEDMKKLCQFFVELEGSLSNRPGFLVPDWVLLLGRAARFYLATAGRELEDANRLVAWGRRRANSFLGDSSTEIPRLCQLSDRRVFAKTLRLFQPSSPREPKIAWLRKHLSWDTVSDTTLENALIRYPMDTLDLLPLSPEEQREYIRHDHSHHPDRRLKLRSGNWAGSHEGGSETGADFASLLPGQIAASVSSDTEHVTAYRRWVCAYETMPKLVPKFKSGTGIENVPSFFRYDPWAVPNKSSVLTAAALRVAFRSDSDDIYGLYRISSVDQSQSSGDISLDMTGFAEPPLVPEKMNFNPGIPPCEGLYDTKDRPYGCPEKWYIELRQQEKDYTTFNCWFGSPNDVAVYSPVAETPHLKEMSLDEILEALKNNEFDCDALAAHLFEGTESFWLRPEIKPLLMSLEVLFKAYRLYQDMPNALIDLKLTSKPLHNAKWATSPSSHGQAFACIAMFELGAADIDPLDILGVTALSYRNSLYIPKYLLQDPYEPPSETAIIRTVGNIGRPGLAVLVSPKNLEIKKPDYSTWKQINHAEFDGKIESNFQETSLHLRFTGYESAINVRDHGLYDKEVFILQAVIQGFDRGTWVADLDLVTLMTGFTEKQLYHRLEPCEHSPTADKLEDYETITSVDSWD